MSTLCTLLPGNLWPFNLWPFHVLLGYQVSLMVVLVTAAWCSKLYNGQVVDFFYWFSRLKYVCQSLLCSSIWNKKVIGLEGFISKNHEHYTITLKVLVAFLKPNEIFIVEFLVIGAKLHVWLCLLSNYALVISILCLEGILLIKNGKLRGLGTGTSKNTLP